MYSFEIEQAIKAAAILHQDHTRKGSIAIPYFTHLVSVMMIVRDYTSDETTLVAALLHDTLEDTDYTAEEIRGDFSKEIAGIVLTLTEPTGPDGEELPWLERKQRYAKQIKKGPEEAVLIAAADKIHNFRTMIEQYHTDHHGFLQDFAGTLEERLEGYQAIANTINGRLKDGIVHEFNHVFELYKQFLIDVQASQERGRV